MRPGTRLAVPAVPGTRPATRWRRRLVANETAATSGVMYADEGPHTIDVRHLYLLSIAKFCDGDFEENVEEMVGTTREAADGDRVRRGRDRG